jgi:hypothetical protein
MPTRATTLLPLPDGRLVANSAEPNRSTAGYPFLVLSPERSVIGKFGSQDPVFSIDRQHLLDRSFAPARADRFWALWAQEYRLEQWSSRGTLIAVLERQPEWLRSAEENSGPWRSSAAPPVMSRWGGLQRDRLGRLWIRFFVPDRRWQAALQRLPSGEQDVVDPSRYFDTIVDVVDPLSGSVLASRRFDEYLGPLLDGPRVAVYRLSDRHEPFLDVWSLTMRQ